MKGTFYAKAVVGKDADGNDISGLRESKEKKTPFFYILFEITRGSEDAVGKRFGWDGWLTDGSKARTIESLFYCGWEGDDLANPVGIDKNEVQIVLEEETYKAKVKKPDGSEVEEPRVRSRVAWVNDPQRSGSVHAPMAADQKKAFADSLKGDIAAQRAQRGKPSPTAKQAESFDFGANVPPGATPGADAAPPPAEPKATQPDAKAGL